jgi:NADPH-dependent 2,4-dienoyl-CoA reductase/sulfur reductase-like enzyme
VTRVAVVGAGLAGLAAADALRSGGAEATTLEACDRLRVRAAGPDTYAGDAEIHRPTS